ncbi:MAG: tetratricopeptide (TPR) repeat protein [Bradymonadia bacterium]|jgi:tetratricopeptide (TPR) repeat protein
MNGLRLGLRCGVAACVMLVSSAGAKEIGDLRAEAVAAQTRVGALEAKYLRTALLERENKITARISNGQLFYLTGDYERASMVLLDVAQRSDSERHPGYREALYYLADSLYQLRNYSGASRWFEKVATIGKPEQKERAIGRLLEIAVATRNWAAATRYLGRAQAMLSGGDADPALLYSVGKFHYRSDRFDKALSLFARVPATHPDWYRARFYRGVTLIQLRRLGEAMSDFELLVTRADESEGLNDGQGAAVDEARLSIGRLHYENGELGKAISAYASVPRTSKVFDRALYESVWISIKQKEYERALRKLEIQLISQPEVIRGPDARLLQGKLLLMLSRFDEATKALQEVLFEFEPMQAEMRRIIRRNSGDLITHFNQVIGRSIAEFDLSSFLPGRAAEFAEDDVEADRALRLVSDLATQRRDIDGMRRTIARLETALNADSRIQIYPKLSEGWVRAGEERAMLALMRGELLDLAAKSMSRKPAVYRRMRARRQAIAKDYRTVPRSATALMARGARMTDEIRRIDQDLYKLDVAIRGLQAQLTAITRYIQDRARIEGPSDRDTRTLANVDIELAQAKQLRAELRLLADAIESERIEVGVGDYASARDETRRQQYLATIELELVWLRARGVTVPIDILATIRDADVRAGRFQRTANNLVDDQVADLQDMIEREKRNIGGYELELATHQAETETLGGAIAARNFRAVLARVDALVLEADIGLVDVAWKQKRDKSAQITTLLDRQAADLKALERSYLEVTSE